MSDKIQVILVEDSILFRNLVKSVLEENPRIEVVSQATNGKLALPRIHHYKPDVLILDQEMPEMSGLELLREIRGKYPDMGIIMLSSHTLQGAYLTLKCLEEGAWDFVTKPNQSTDGDPIAYLKRKLIPRVLEYAKRKHKKITLSPPLPQKVNSDPPQTVLSSGYLSDWKKTRSEASERFLKGYFKACGIGISTGGPVALRDLFQKFNCRISAPIFIVQHMPPLFTRQLAESLNELTPIQVQEAEEGMLALPNHCYLAPGGRHMVLDQTSKGDTIIRITDDPPEENCKPSVNMLFRSMAKIYKERALAIIMTGMGTDGYRGILDLKVQNSYTIGQSKESCLVFGMPERPIQENLVDEIQDIQGIAERMKYLLGAEKNE